MALTLDGTNGIVSSGSITTQSATGVIFSDSSNQGAAASPFSLKNRIINGDMVISQRNAGASVTIPATGGQYTLDRWAGAASQASKYSIQQNAGSVTPPAGFTNYLGVTSLSAYSITSSDLFNIQQPIEGFNIADLAWGTASAKTVTLSFWVRSSLTGTFGGALQNSAVNRTYPFSYTISSANTWEQKSVTIAGDTSGTWLTTNGIGIQVILGLGVGSTLSGTAGSWSGSAFYSATGATSVVGTNGATFYITGVQLERNTTATPFEWLPIGTELALCQRYFETNFTGVSIPTSNYSFYVNLPVGSNTYAGGGGQGQQTLGMHNFKVSKRAAPTVTIYSWISNTTTAVSNGWTGTDFGANSGQIAQSTFEGFTIFNGTGSSITTGGYSVLFNYAASAEI
jgi:hypothetical protein